MLNEQKWGYLPIIKQVEEILEFDDFDDFPIEMPVEFDEFLGSPTGAISQVPAKHRKSCVAVPQVPRLDVAQKHHDAVWSAANKGILVNLSLQRVTGMQMVMLYEDFWTVVICLLYMNKL